MSQGRVDVHGFLTFLELLFRRLILHGAHIVQPVGDLDQHHPDVLGHGHEHFTQIFHLRLLGGGEIGLGQLGDTLDQLGHGLAEDLFNVGVGGIRVLNAVVEQGAQHGVDIQTHFRHDLGHGQRVNDVGRTVLSELIPVLDPSIVDSLVDQRHVRIGHTLQNGVSHGGIVFFKGFHFLFQLSFARRSACMV